MLKELNDDVDTSLTDAWQQDAVDAYVDSLNTTKPKANVSIDTYDSIGIWIIGAHLLLA